MMTHEEYLAEINAMLEADAASPITRRSRSKKIWEHACELADKSRWLARSKAQPEPYGGFPGYCYADAYLIAKNCLERINKIRSEMSVRPYYRGEEEDYMAIAPDYALLLMNCDLYGVKVYANPDEQDDHRLQAYDLIEVAP